MLGLTCRVMHSVHSMVATQLICHPLLSCYSPKNRTAAPVWDMGSIDARKGDTPIAIDLSDSDSKLLEDYLDEEPPTIPEEVCESVRAPISRFLLSVSFRCHILCSLSLPYPLLLSGLGFRVYPFPLSGSSHLACNAHLRSSDEALALLPDGAARSGAEVRHAVIRQWSDSQCGW